MGALRDQIESLFPNIGDQLMQQCLGPLTVPLGQNHSELFFPDIARLIPAEALERIRLGYILLAAYYFRLDAIIDDHLAVRSDATYLSHFISGAFSEFTGACLRIAPNLIPSLNTLLRYHLAANARAIEIETSLSASPLIYDREREFESTVGRSNAVLFLYEFLCLLTKTRISCAVVSWIEQLICHIQMIDDLGDWRDDYRAHRYTPLLRYCFHRYGKVLAEGELENELLLRGVVEQQAARTISELDALLQSVANDRPDLISLYSYIASQRSRLYNDLATRLDIKASAINRRNHTSETSPCST